MRSFAKYMAGIMLAAMPVMAETLPSVGEAADVELTANIDQYVTIVAVEDLTWTGTKVAPATTGSQKCDAPATITVTSNCWSNWQLGIDNTDITNVSNGDTIPTSYGIDLTGTFSLDNGAGAPDADDVISGTNTLGGDGTAWSAVSAINPNWVGPSPAGATIEVSAWILRSGLNDRSGSYASTITIDFVGAIDGNEQ